MEELPEDVLFEIFIHSEDVLVLIDVLTQCSKELLKRIQSPCFYNRLLSHVEKEFELSVGAPLAQSVYKRSLERRFKSFTRRKQEAQKKLLNLAPFKALEARDLAELGRLLASGVLVRSLNERGEDLFFLAIKSNYVDAVKLLLDRGYLSERSLNTLIPTSFNPSLKYVMGCYSAGYLDSVGRGQSVGEGYLILRLAKGSYDIFNLTGFDPIYLACLYHSFESLEVVLSYMRTRSFEMCRRCGMGTIYDTVPGAYMIKSFFLTSRYPSIKSADEVDQWSIVEQEIRRVDLDIRFVRLIVGLCRSFDSDTRYLLELLRIKIKATELLIQSKGDENVLSKEACPGLQKFGWIGVRADDAILKDLCALEEIFAEMKCAYDKSLQRYQ